MATINTIISLTDNMSSKLTTIKGSVDGVVESMEGIGNGLQSSQTAADNMSWDTFISNAEAAGERMTEIGNQMTKAITAPLVQLGKKSYGNAVAYESAMTGVKKTVSGTEEQYEILDSQLRDISERTTSRFEDLAGYVQIGGQSGVSIDQAEEFAEVIAALESATDHHISGESGVADIISFLNIMDKGVDKIEQFGSSIVYLGNTYNATEDQILAMANRMAASADLADFSTAQVMGMATAFTAVGINAEAGGSAASKLIKQFQLAAEVGSNAQSLLSEDYGNAVDFSYYISSKDNLLAVAQEMETTTDHVLSMADSWLSLEQFSEVSGKTADQFVQDWSNDPAQGLIDFFYGLNSIDASGIESTLAMLDEMGITEIRQSNLVAGMATNPELFESAVLSAAQAYEENVAMWEEFYVAMDTQESQNQMLANKFDNSMADLGDNLVEALQPALDMMNNLLDAFNSLSEADQDKIIEAFKIFALAGPIVTVIGETISTISDIGKGMDNLVNGSWGTNIVDFFSGPAGWVTLGVTAIVGLIAYIDSIPTKAEEVAAALQNIPITIDQTSYDETVAAIDGLQGMIDELRADPVQMEFLDNTSTAVKMGYGTSNMYGEALGYEAALFNDEYSSLVADYTAQMREAESGIINATSEADKLLWANKYQSLEDEMGVATTEAKQSYAQSVSDLYNGMISKDEELARKLETASKQYDLVATLSVAEDVLYNMDVPDNWGQMSRDEQEAYENAYTKRNDALKSSIVQMASELGYISQTYDEAMAQLEFGTPFDTLIHGVYEKSMDDMQNSIQEISDNPIANSWLQSILDNPALTENLDMTMLDGAMSGIVKALDFNTAMESALADGDADNFGAYLMEGLANGVNEYQHLATDAAAGAGTATIDAEGETLGVNSPSIYAMEQGHYVAEGLALGISNGSAVVNAAIVSMGAMAIANMQIQCNQVVATASSILSFSTGNSIGLDITAGIAAGILAGQSEVIAASRTVANAAASSMRSTLKIASPSKVFEEMGGFVSQGFANGIRDGADQVTQSIAKVSQAASSQMNDDVWSMISDYNALEFNQMNDEDSELSVSDSDLKKVRELAEREVINQFTTAEVKVEFTANNQINSDLDIDDVVAHLEDLVSERLEVVAGGVYD